MAFLRANIAPELQDAAVAAIADTIGETAATRPGEAEQAHHSQQPSQIQVQNVVLNSVTPAVPARRSGAP